MFFGTGVEGNYALKLWNYFKTKGVKWYLEQNEYCIFVKSLFPLRMWTDIVKTVTQAQNKISHLFKIAKHQNKFDSKQIQDVLKHQRSLI